MPNCDECAIVAVAKQRDICASCKMATRECRKCLEVKSIFAFEKNQRTPLGARNRRSECKDCRKGRKTISAKVRKEFEAENPRPAVGDTFQCPICRDMFTVNNNQSVNLDHDNDTGEIRGWICGSCNTSIGRLGDDISTLARAILWIKNKGKLLSFMF